MSPEQASRWISGFGKLEIQALLIASILTLFFSLFHDYVGLVIVSGLLTFVCVRLCVWLSVRLIDFILEDFPKARKLLSRLSIVLGLLFQINIVILSIVIIIYTISNK